ncbi:MAG: zinc ribbon domain-containing protein, partial [Solirubrobacterales bacterium]
MLFALFGIGNDALNLVVNLLLLSLVVVYFALVAWTFFDARRRMEDQVLVASAVGASFVFPFIGTVIYSILRPPEFLEDAHEREVEIKAAELRVKQLTEQSCPKCEYPIEKSYLRCPNCRARLKDPCTSCGKPVDPRWSLCPYCETPLEKPARRAPSREARPSRERQAREPQPSR